MDMTNPSHKLVIVFPPSEFLINEDNSPSTVRGSGSSFSNAIAISDEDEEVINDSQKSQEFTFKYVTLKILKTPKKERGNNYIFVELILLLGSFGDILFYMYFVLILGMN